MNTRAAIATARCATDYSVLLSALAHDHARLLHEYRALSRANNKCQWLDERVEDADTVSKQLAAVSAMCAAHSMHPSVLLHSVGHMSMLAQSLKKCQAWHDASRAGHTGVTGRG